MNKSKSPKIVQNPDAPVEREILAEAIVKISKATKRQIELLEIIAANTTQESTQ